MEKFVARQNVAHYRELLERETDPDERRRLEALLAEARLVMERQAKPKLGH